MHILAASDVWRKPSLGFSRLGHKLQMLQRYLFNSFKLRIPSKLITGLCCGVLLCAGCSKSKHEGRIIGKRSDPPVSLRCTWQPGYRYHVRLELMVLTDPAMTGPNDTDQHRVTFEQECL